VRDAREHAVGRARAAGANEDDVALVVGELVINVVVHGQPTSAVSVATHVARGVFWVTVSAQQREVMLPDVAAESGRGLLIARALTVVFRCETRQGGYQAFVAGFAARTE